MEPADSITFSLVEQTFNMFWLAINFKFADRYDRPSSSSSLIILLFSAYHGSYVFNLPSSPLVPPNMMW